jgi:hypothetical protein
MYLFKQLYLVSAITSGAFPHYNFLCSNPKSGDQREVNLSSELYAFLKWITLPELLALGMILSKAYCL